MTPPVLPKDVNLADAIFSLTALKTVVFQGLKEQIPLMQAFCLALSLHVLAFPVIWFLGWSLPWPKSPVVTTIIEIDLRNWPESAKPDKLFHFRDPEKNK